MKILRLLFLVVLLNGCKKKENNSEINIISIPSFNSHKEIPFSTFVDSTFTIKLETKESCILGRIDKIQIHNDRIFILDRHVAKGVFEFSMQGEFIRQYGKRGKAPGEYTGLRTFTIDKKYNRVILYDWAKRVLIHYSSDGDYLETKTLTFRCNGLELFEGYFIADIANIDNTHFKSSSEYKKYELATMSQEEGNLRTFIQSKYNMPNFLSSSNLSRNETSILFNKPYSNTIYSYKQGKVFPDFELKFEDKSIPLPVLRSYKNLNQFRNILNKSNYTYLNNTFKYALVNDKLMFTASKGNENKSFLYSIKTNKLYNLLKTIDFSANYLSYYGKLLGTYDEFVISELSPSFFTKKNIIEAFDSEAIKAYLRNFNENDNPILVFNRLRRDL